MHRWPCLVQSGSWCQRLIIVPVCVQMALHGAMQGKAALVPGALAGMLQRVVEEQGALLVAQRAELQERVRRCALVFVLPFCVVFSSLYVVVFLCLGLFGSCVCGRARGRLLSLFLFAFFVCVH